MKTLLLLLMGIIFLIGFVSATTIIAGNNYTFSVDTTDNLFWDVVNNQSNMEGFEVHQDIYDNYSNITFIVDYRFAPDTFTIILFSNKTKEIIKEVPVGGGGGGTSYKTEYVDRYHTIYQDKIIQDDEEIIKLNDDIKRMKDDLEKKNREIIMFACLSSVSLVALFFLLKHIIKHKKHKKNH